MGETARIQSHCVGRQTLSTKVDSETRGWIEAQAAEANVSCTELLRRLLDLYRASETGRFSCPHCGRGVDLASEVDL